MGALLVIILTSCAPIAKPTPTKLLVQTDTFTPVLTSKLSPIPAIASPLPTQLTIVPTLNPTQAKQQTEIKGVIQVYFDIHYRALSVSPPEDFPEAGFGDLVSDGPDAKDFLATEMGKLAVERKHYELNKLRYVEYEYSLTYKDIIVDASAKMATVLLGELFEVIRESAVEANPEDPHISRGGLSHEIVLRNEQGEWKIVSHTYKDALWRTLRKPESTIDEILRSIEIMLEDLEEAAKRPTLREMPGSPVFLDNIS